MIEDFGGYVEDLNAKLLNIASDHEEEKRALVDIRNTLKNSPGFSKGVSSKVTDDDRGCEKTFSYFLRVVN
jgi:hypothetical protein